MVSDEAVALQDSSWLEAASSSRVKAGRLGIKILGPSGPSGTHAAHNRAAHQNDYIAPYEGATVIAAHNTLFRYSMPSPRYLPL